MNIAPILASPLSPFFTFTNPACPDFFPEVSFPSEEQLQAMPVAELKEFLAQHGGSAKGALERADLEERARRLVLELSGTKCAVICFVL